jgi:arylamine N-acetyltransferase
MPNSLDPLLSRLLKHCGLPLHGSPSTLLENTLSAFSKIPYENLSKIVRHADTYGIRHKESPEELIHGFIERGSGGTCFPLTHTLVYFLRALQYEAHPILADRRYGQDTHCAVLFRGPSEPWQLLDPGYLVFSPCTIPLSGSVRYELLLSSIELKALDQSKLELYTTTLDSSGSIRLRYRLTYKLKPIDASEFTRAWDRSFDWEMMTYPIVSAIRGDSLVYLQKNNLLVRSRDTATRVTLSNEQIVAELATRLGVSQDVVSRALINLS